MSPRTPLRCAAAFVLAACGTAQAAPLTIGLLVRADDERLASPRAELAYPGHPTGPAQQGVEVALREAQFELEAAKLQPKLEVIEVRTPDEARAAAQKLEKAGAAALLAELPADALLAAAGAVKLAVFNLGESADALRQQQCRPNLLHTLPSERMRSDALAQHLVARKWSRVLLLHGPRPADAQRLASVELSLKRYGLKTVARRPFKLSADPRERDLANPLLLTGGADHDVVWVVDTDGEFARGLPYRTALPRPVVGDAGLFALAWAPNFERFGAPQLARRFARHAKRPMTGEDWAAWMATKAVVQAAVAKPSGPWAPAGWTAPDFTLDGFKGTRLSFRAWDRQLRQPLLLSDGQGVVGSAPVEGLLHPSNVLDTLGADAPEKLCRTGA
ncbi:ABC transporter substrate-binding protein [Caldimonas tepidiphila]|uniref:ABC transporter substrate-binding protein n=1 Tax=Caldimonas tepidiphila TaxID=2315841 RepID=UPI000E5A6417|nr:ABC transporter substrate-binding protein [Caldimonas tepidiphila]